MRPALSLKTLYRSPVRMILMYWSPVIKLSDRPAPTVELTMPIGRLLLPLRESIRLDSSPLALIAPPNVIAHIMSHIVGNIPSIPRVEMSSSIIGVSLCRDVEVKSVVIIPSTTCIVPYDVCVAISRKASH